MAPELRSGLRFFVQSPPLPRPRPGRPGHRSHDGAQPGQMHGGSVRAFSEGPGRGSARSSCGCRASRRPSRPRWSRPGRPILRVATAPRPRRRRQRRRRAAARSLLRCSVTCRPWSTTDQRALALRSSPPPELVLIDIGLPGMDGYAARRALRNRPRWRRPGRRHRLRPPGRHLPLPKAGFDDHLVKPVDLRDLEAHGTANRSPRFMRRRRVSARAWTITRALASPPGTAQETALGLIRSVDLALPPEQRGFARRGSRQSVGECPARVSLQQSSIGLRRMTGSACVKKPKGRPYEKYKQPSRPSLAGVDSVATFVAAFMSAPSCW